MSTASSTLDSHTLAMPPETPVSSVQAATKAPRILACILCQQRKVRCDRKFPCANCVKSRVQCIPANQTQRRRRRRFPERDLLDRLRKYEDILRQHDIAFEPLHKDAAQTREQNDADSDNDMEDEQTESAPPGLSTASPTKPARAYEAKNIWHAMSQGFRDPGNESDSSHDDIRETVIRKAWDQLGATEDHYFFGAERAPIDVSAFHPDPVQIFRLWQIYLDNVNPLLKVTHTPSLQARIIEAAANITIVAPAMEALMFGIYSTAIMSLLDRECQAMFGSTKDDLSARYQAGCREALLNCGFLRTKDRDCLTALYLYLVAVRPNALTDSLSSMMGIAIRIAQRMGIHSESMLARCTVLEAEMRRRLWWSLVFFDTRVSEIVHTNTTTLNPTWDCKIPLNVNDSDLRSDMKSAPPIQGRWSEATFVVVRCQMGDYIRQAEFHLDFTCPALKPLARYLRSDLKPDESEVSALEEMVETQYLKFCDQESPLQHLTIWTTRLWLARSRLIEHHAKHASTSARQTDAQIDTATSYALKMLEYDTKIMSSPLSKGFRWLNQAQFPFPAYVQLVQDLRRRPTHAGAPRAWEVMSDNHDAWADFRAPQKKLNPFLQIFTKIVLKAWEACEASSSDRPAGESDGISSNGGGLNTPRIVLSLREIQAQRAQLDVTAHNEIDISQSPSIATDMDIDDFLASMSMPTMPMMMPTLMPPSATIGLEPSPATTTMPYMYPGMPVPSLQPQAPPAFGSHPYHQHPLWTAFRGGRPASGWGGPGSSTDTPLQ